VVLGEQLGRTDVAGTVVIVGGVVLATIFGSHCESSYTADDLLELYTRTPFLVVATLTVVSMCVALAVIRTWRKTLPEHISTDDMEAMESGAPTRVCIAYAFMAGSMGALMQIVFKGTGELIGAEEFGHWALWMSVALVIIIATAQMSYLNQGMAVCTAVVFFPTYNACFIVMTTLTGPPLTVSCLVCAPSAVIAPDPDLCVRINNVANRQALRTTRSTKRSRVSRCGLASPVASLVLCLECWC
jgi:drug/metabolite transporter (DMT)-like permease